MSLNHTARLTLLKRLHLPKPMLRRYTVYLSIELGLSWTEVAARPDDCIDCTAAQNRQATGNILMSLVVVSAVVVQSGPIEPSASVLVPLLVELVGDGSEDSAGDVRSLSPIRGTMWLLFSRLCSSGRTFPSQLGSGSSPVDVIVIVASGIGSSNHDTTSTVTRSYHRIAIWITGSLDARRARKDIYVGAVDVSATAGWFVLSVAVYEVELVDEWCGLAEKPSPPAIVFRPSRLPCHTFSVVALLLFAVVVGCVGKLDTRGKWKM
uniref:Uncharacterized protein n=1 Tax=Anopheles farauti TaxID=69004 RepID=A0A182QZJ8_9DIPT